ncbi:MAG: molybdopterin-dependent oxidoreductase [Methanobacteriaceae archaeon]|nr:molybdopterin-dependent oxidoreductase [Methanobacteriaceae archaeon]
MFKVAHTICPSCSVGCGVNLIIKDQEAVGTYPYKRHPINEGKNCKKGRDSFKMLGENRLKNPLIKKGGLEKASWEEALYLAASQFKSYENHEIGIIASGNCTNQEYEILKKFSEKLKIENIGYNSPNSTTFDLETATLSDVENSNFILIMGDILKENPLIGRRVILAKDDGAEIITLDYPEKTLTSINSEKYLQIQASTSIMEQIDSDILNKLDQSSTVLIGKLEDKNEFNKVLKFFQQSNAKILPVLEDCNGRGAMNILPALGEDDLKGMVEKVKLLYVLGDDPVSYMEDYLKNVDFIITQGYFVNETVLMSDLVLPGSCWAEKSGSFTNTTGEIQKFKKIVATPGNAMDDVKIIHKIADKLGLDL